LNTGGIIIRLIDVAMIILFGFIAISDVKVRAQIKLPAEDKEQLETEEDEPVVVFVKVDPYDGFLIERDDAVLHSTTEVAELEAQLSELFKTTVTAGRKLVVLIEPHEDSMIQHTVDVLDICERNTIPFNINYDSMQF